MADEEILIPNVRISAHDPAAELLSEGFDDRDNFVRNLVTVLLPGQVAATGGGGAAVPPLPRAVPLDPVVPVSLVKEHLRISPSQTVEDSYLQLLEMAARIHTENVLRRQLDAATASENVKLAMLLLIAHWYRNRESVAEGETYVVPQSFNAILAPERDYTDCYS